jgi:deoxyribonuclease-4
MSIAGGLYKAVERGVEVGATALQVFTSSSNQWHTRDLTPEEIARFRDALAASTIGAVVAHDSYLINLASPDAALWRRSVDAFVEEIRRCATLGIGALVFHPGAHMGEGETAGVARIAKAVNEAHRRTAASRVLTLLETHAGQGTTLGHRFEHLRDILAALKDPSRAGVCLDTCHVFAAGYPIHTAEGWDRTLSEFDTVIGLARLKAVHVNDSKKDLGSRVDRHAGLGEGMMGFIPFFHLVHDPRTRSLPLILETPKGDDLAEDRVNLATLRRLAAASRP